MASAPAHPDSNRQSGKVPEETLTVRPDLSYFSTHLAMGTPFARCHPTPPMPRPILLFFLLYAFASFGCSKTFIPNTDVEDSGENRKVVLFCEEYRHAVEDKNVGLLLKMASPRYHEDGGNTNDEDDIDYEGLKEYLAGTFVRTQAIRYEIRYRRVTFTETNRIYVDYTFATSYRIPGVKGQEWKHSVADNRLELVPDGEGYKIVAGM